MLQIQKEMFYLFKKNVVEHFVGENKIDFQIYFNFCSVCMGRLKQKLLASIGEF